MHRRNGDFPALRLVTGFVVCWLLAIGVASASSRAPSAPPTAPPAAALGYVGDDTCVTCHESEGKTLPGTLHGKIQNPRTPAGAGNACESCHGPGQAHAEAGGDITKIKRVSTMTPRAASEMCITCHNKGDHANWQGSMHDARNVSCQTCHSVHDAKSDHAQLKTANAIDTCVSCHKQEAMKVKRSGHMPVREGKMDCATCHNPHGSNNVRMLKTGNWINESCTSCHTEKRGPFLYEHSAGRENCASCHDPHGSNNDRMLVAKAPMLCQRCHVSSRHPATIYDKTQVSNASNRVVGRACVNCHSQIHGSNHPAGDRFLR
jgi:DmsE family decaheme c-type cytochrome